MLTFHAFLGCSLDGFIAGENGDLDWLTVFENTGYDAFFASVDVLVMGRSSFEVMREVAPDHYRGKPVHVLSSALAEGQYPDLGESPVTFHRDISSMRTALSALGVRRAYADGGKLVQSLITAKLLTDITITRVPVLIGEGIPLFGPVPAAVSVQHVESHATEQGAVQSLYRFPDVVG